MAIPFKKSPIETNQRTLFPSNIFDLLAKDHECYVYEEIFHQLNTASVEEKYSIRGQNAYHPRLITGILIYAYSQGVFSSRQIEKKCKEDLGYMYIADMSCPNFRVLSDFRKENHEFFKECFKQSVLLAMEAGMVRLGHVSLDGSKFKADTSKHKAMSYGRLKEKEKELTAEIEVLVAQAETCDEEENREYKEKTGYEIPEDLKHKQTRLEKIRAAKTALEKREEALHPGQQIEDKKQISFADTEARIMGKKGAFEYSYNGQISVDEKNQIIVGQHISQNANDKLEVKPALQQIEETTGATPDEMSLDNGYLSGGNLEALAGTGIDAYIATGKGESRDQKDLDACNRKVDKSDFSYDAQTGSYMCPSGHKLELKTTSAQGKKTYSAAKTDCDACIYRSRCCSSAQGQPRSITTDDNEPLRQEMVKKMKQKSAREKYRKRKQIVEPVFGQIKNSGFRGFSLRGLVKVAGEFCLVCAVHNLKKIAKAIRNGNVCLDEGKLVQAAA